MNTVCILPFYYHIIPCLFILAYLHYPKHIRIHPSILFFFSVIHNSGLVLFSGWTFISMIRVLREKGIIFQSYYYYQFPIFDSIQWYFYISKYYEFLDTFLLYLNGKQPIFLQKYHHIGAVIGWHLSYVYKVDAVFLSTTMNSFVHTIMYSYYLGSLFKIKSIKWYKPYITTLQITQFIIGLYLFKIYFPPIETNFNYSLLILSQIYNIGLIFLFGYFSYQNYICKIVSIESITDSKS